MNVDALAAQGVEVDGHGRGERLALAGLHLGDLTLVQGDTAHDLHVEGPHPVRLDVSRTTAYASGRMSSRLALAQPLAELVRLSPSRRRRRASISGSSAVTASTRCWRAFTFRPSPILNIFVSRLGQ